MPLQAAYQPYTLRFRFEAGTSRGTFTEKKTWIIKIWEKGTPEVFGLGEVGPLKGLSVDGATDYTAVLEKLLPRLEDRSLPSGEDECLRLAGDLTNGERPALQFGLETALLDLWTAGRRKPFPSDFTSGRHNIPVNGLVWMGTPEFMRRQARDKIKEGYTCLKMKIGAIGFDAELDIIKMLKEEGVTVLRVDANGAFSPGQVRGKLEKLAAFGLHSIEQPIAAGQWDKMREVVASSPVPVALDEELIGIPPDQQDRLLDTIEPPYIILKPTLLGGLAATRTWIRKAEERGIGWWITSALESNIGLNVIAQQTAILHYRGHQGLGTGQLYENNFDSPMVIRKGEMQYDNAHSWNFDKLEIC